jgi:DNA-binding MarR family transcriptional regulator
MKRYELTNKEKLVLYGLIKYPDLKDKQLSEKLNVKPSTVTSIRHRLKKNEFFKSLWMPLLQNIGCEILAVIYTNFNPLINLDERVKITSEAIEIFEEIFLSIGEQDKGFSLSFSKDYTTIERINEIRTQLFGKLGLLEDEYPNMVLFPFETSKIYRFFDFSPLLRSFFKLKVANDTVKGEIGFKNDNKKLLSDSEKKVYYAVVKYPDLLDNDIGIKLGISRHTVSRLKKKFIDESLLRRLNLPNIKKLGFKILAFYHIKFNPKSSPDLDEDEVLCLISDSTIFMASKRFETVLLSVYANYDDYKSDKTRIIRLLKENRWITKDPMIRTYSLSKLAIIKDFEFAPIAKKILRCDISI